MYVQRNTKTKNKFLIEKFNKKNFQHIYLSRYLISNADGAIHMKKKKEYRLRIHKKKLTNESSSFIYEVSCLQIWNDSNDSSLSLLLLNPQKSLKILLTRYNVVTA